MYSLNLPKDLIPRNLLEEFNKVSQSYSSPNVENKVQPEIKKKSTRCTSCKKKTGLLGFECRCGGNFCGAHRHADQHECIAMQDFINKDKEVLVKQNIKVVADKMEKI
jgi:hypothetical protein